MILYHGSCVGGLTRLEPYLSEHKKPYVYFSSNPVVAMLYSVKPVPKPFSFYPYGFDREGVVVYSEYFKNAFERIYSGKVGYLYECEDIMDAENPTAINCAYTLSRAVDISCVTEIKDCYTWFKEYEKQGRFRIKTFQDVSENEMHLLTEDFNNYIQKYDLKNKPDNEMSIFIRTFFPHIWDVK